MDASPSSTPGLKRSLSVWAAVGLSVALMAPSMAANINPQGSATYAGRAVPLTNHTTHGSKILANFARQIPGED